MYCLLWFWCGLPFFIDGSNHPLVALEYAMCFLSFRGVLYERTYVRSVTPLILMVIPCCRINLLSIAYPMLPG